MKKHIVTFCSPGTLISEQSSYDIDSWDVGLACVIAKSIKERHGATPYGFRFLTQEQKEGEWGIKTVDKSPFYWLGGTIRYREDILKGTDPEEDILRWNVEHNNIKAIIENNNSWKFTSELNEGDVVLPWPIP